MKVSPWSTPVRRQEPSTEVAAGWWRSLPAQAFETEPAKAGLARYSRDFSRRLGVLLSVLFVGACAAPQTRGTCIQVSDRTDIASLRELYRVHQIALVVARSSVLACSCAERRDIGAAAEDRSLAGAAQDRDLGGAAQDRDLGGAAQDRDLGGAAQDRDLGGAAQDRDLGGAAQDRDLGGAAQDRDLGGGTQVFTCCEEPRCDGFSISGGGPFQVFDGLELRPVTDRCVIE